MNDLSPQDLVIDWPQHLSPPVIGAIHDAGFFGSGVISGIESGRRMNRAYLRVQVRFYFLITLEVESKKPTRIRGKVVTKKNEG